MLLPLKQHFLIKLSPISIFYTNTVQTWLKIFPITRFLGRLPGVPSTGELFENAYTSDKTRRKQIKKKTLANRLWAIAVGAVCEKSTTQFCVILSLFYISTPHGPIRDVLGSFLFLLFFT